MELPWLISRGFLVPLHIGNKKQPERLLRVMTTEYAVHLHYSNPVQGRDRT